MRSSDDPGGESPVEDNAPTPSGAPGARWWYLPVLALCGFVTSFGAHVVATNLPAYAREVGVGALAIGLLIAVYDFAELFAKPAAGFVADRRGMKLTLLVGIGVFVVGSLLFLVISPRLLLLVRFIQGLGAAALSTVSITLVARYFTRGRGRAFGIYNAIKGAGYVVAPPIGGFLVHWRGFGAIFVVSAAVAAIALALSLFLPADRRRRDALADDEDDEITFGQFVAIFRDPRLLPVYAVIVVNMFLVGVLFGFLPVYLYGIGYSPVRSGWVVSIGTLSYLIFQPLAGHLADRFDIRLTVLAGLLVASVAIILLPFTAAWPLLLVVAVAGVGIGTVWTNSDALVGSLARAGRLGASVGAAQSFKEFGDMIGPLLIGLLTQSFGVRVGFVSCGVLALSSLPLLAARWERASETSNNKVDARK